MQSEAEQLVLLAQENEHLYMSRAMEANMGLVVQKACRSSVSGLEHEELISEMRLATIKAIRAFSAERGAAWSTYLHKCLNNAMGNLVKQRQSKERYKMDNTLELKDWQPVYDHTPTLYWPIEGLSTYDSVVLELRYIHQLTLGEIGRYMGLIPQTIQYHVNRAIGRAQKILGVTLKTKMGYDKRAVKGLRREGTPT